MNVVVKREEPADAESLVLTVAALLDSGIRLDPNGEDHGPDVLAFV